MTKPESLGLSSREIIKQEMEKRRRNIDQYDRVVLTKKPHYSGESRSSTDGDNLFEIFIKNRFKEKFSGVVEDVFGTATVDGEITKQKVFFIKQYIPEKTLDYCSKNKIKYEGYYSHDEGIYSGRWQELDTDHPLEGEFILWSDKLASTPSKFSSPKP